MEKTYKNGDLAVRWEPKKCIHSEVCVKGLPSVFNPKAKPWIDIEGAEAERIREQVRLCPSGALSLPDESKKPPMNNEKQSLKVTPNGPVLVTGECEVEMPDGTKEVKSNVALCRCGASSNKPYCDGTHSRIDFKG